MPSSDGPSRQVVMTLHPDQQSENFKYFEAGYDGGSDSRTDGYYMTNDSYEQAGSPEIITVAVIPGNRRIERIESRREGE